jgi:hypothetical protein
MPMNLIAWHASVPDPVSTYARCRHQSGSGPSIMAFDDGRAAMRPLVRGDARTVTEAPEVDRWIADDRGLGDGRTPPGLFDEAAGGLRRKRWPGMSWELLWALVDSGVELPLLGRPLRVASTSRSVRFGATRSTAQA